MNAGTIIGLGFLFFMAVNAFRSTVGFVRDTAADTFPGMILGVKSVVAEKAAGWLSAQKWLTKSYREKLLTSGYASRYRLDVMGAYAAEDIAKDIINANMNIFGEGALNRLISWGMNNTVGGGDNPTEVIQAVRRIKNQVQALEVVEYYYMITGKNLVKGLMWLPDEYLIEVYEYLKSIGTGAYDKNTGRELSNLPNV